MASIHCIDSGTCSLSFHYRNNLEDISEIRNTFDEGKLLFFIKLFYICELGLGDPITYPKTFHFTFSGRFSGRILLFSRNFLRLLHWIRVFIVLSALIITNQMDQVVRLILSMRCKLIVLAHLLILRFSVDGFAVGFSRV